MSQTNAFASAKSAALAHLATAAEQIQALQAATTSASSPKQTGELREASNALRGTLGEAAEAIRYLDQCARRPCVDPVRAAMLRGDVEALRPALLAEVFESVEREASDPEPYMLLTDVWPAWAREHGVEGVELPADLITEDGPWLRLRGRWLPLVAETLRGVVAWFRDDLDADRARLAKLSRLAAEQLGGEAGLVVENGTTWRWTPGEIEEEIAHKSRLAANAAARLAGVSK